VASALPRWLLGPGRDGHGCRSSRRLRNGMASRGAPRERWMWRSGFRVLAWPQGEDGKRSRPAVQADAGAVRWAPGCSGLGGWAMDKQAMKGRLRRRRITPGPLCGRFQAAELSRNLNSCWAGWERAAPAYPCFRQSRHTWACLRGKSAGHRPPLPAGGPARGGRFDPRSGGGAGGNGRELEMCGAREPGGGRQLTVASVGGG